ncbi:MAG TPA: GFA family protein [Stellaceae bacterium]|nr:GFA family protein [Stellaceae bacterium]
MKLPLAGGCQCGAVRYEIAAEPSTVYACHCADCQRQTGSAFALSMVVPRDALRVTAGEPRIWLRPGTHTASGTPAQAMFCGTCGARLYHFPSRAPARAIVKPGTLDDTSWLHAVGHIWTKRAQPWIVLPGDALNYEGQSPDFVALEAAWQAHRRGARARSVAAISGIGAGLAAEDPMGIPEIGQGDR